jgi:hypothetical protein
MGPGVVAGDIVKLAAGAAVAFGTAGAGAGVSAAGGYIARNLLAYVRINAWYLEKIPLCG